MLQVSTQLPANDTPSAVAKPDPVSTTWSPATPVSGLIASRLRALDAGAVPPTWAWTRGTTTSTSCATRTSPGQTLPFAFDHFSPPATRHGSMPCRW